MRAGLRGHRVRPAEHRPEGLASFVVRVEDRTAWRSRAFAGWPMVDNAGDQAVDPGTVIVVTEGPRPVAVFRVDHVHADPLPAVLRNLDLESLIGCTEDDARHRGRKRRRNSSGL